MISSKRKQKKINTNIYVRSWGVQWHVSYLTCIKIRVVLIFAQLWIRAI